MRHMFIIIVSLTFLCGFVFKPSGRVYTANIASNDAVSEESSNSLANNWIDGDCTSAVTGRAVCTLVSGKFTGVPHCFQATNSAFGGKFCGTTSASSSSIQIDCFDADLPGTSNTAFQLVCFDSGQ